MKVAVIYNKPGVDVADVINIFGPQTKEKYNPKTVDRVASALEKGGHNVRIVEGNINVAEELRLFMPRVMAGERSGMIFNMAYGIQGQSRYTHIPAMLEMLGVPYVGSGPQGHAVALDKIMSKIVFQQHNLPTPKFWFFNNPEAKLDKVQFPVIVKPKMEAVSMGLKVVDNADDLREAIQFVLETYQQQALVEEFIAGREFAVGLLGNGADLEILPVVEFDLGDDPNAIQTHFAKMKKPIEKICPANISDELMQKFKNLARNAFQALELCDFARVDFRMDEKNNIYILEINSMASLGLTGSYVAAAKVAGYTYDSLVNKMLDVAAVRYFGATLNNSEEAEASTLIKKQPLRVRLRTYLRSNLTTMEDYLRRMVEVNTYVHNTEGVNMLAEWVASRLKNIGFQRQVFPQIEVGNILYFANHEETQNDILLLSHLDSIYSYQDFVPFREERGRFFGSGVAESKGGLTIMLGALQALRFTRRLKKVRCGVLLTTDDTLGGQFSKKFVADFAAKSKYVVGLKYGDMDGGIVTACSGRANFNFELSNRKTTHSKEAPDVIKIICQKIISWQKLSNDEKKIKIKLSTLNAQTLYGLSPDYAAGSFMVQFDDRTDGELLEKKIKQIAKKGLSTKLQLRIKKTVYRLPKEESEATHRFYNLVKKIASRLEIRVPSVYRYASSDISYVPSNIPVLEGLGPIGGEPRSPSEYIMRDSLIDRAVLLALVIRECAKEA